MTMDYRRLGRSGLKVSEICLGTMTFGNGADQDEASRMVGTAFDAGVNFFDTANSYVGGVSETMLGEALKGRRQNATCPPLFRPATQHCWSEENRLPTIWKECTAGGAVPLRPTVRKANAGAKE